MDAVSYSLASKQAQRIEKFIENPDSTSGIVTVPKVIASGETVTIPSGRVAILPNVQVDGTLNIEGEVFIPSGATFGDLETQLALKAPLSSPAFTGTPTAPTQTAQDNSTKLATTAYVDGKMVLGTLVNSTSGTAIDFTGIPSWAKRITVMFKGVSTNGAANLLVQIGATTIETTGYLGASALLTTGGIAYNNSAGFTLADSNAAHIRHGQATLINLGSNIWVFSNVLGLSSSAEVSLGGGSKSLSGTLDRVRITTVNGADTFDAGSINIMYEG